MNGASRMVAWNVGHARQEISNQRNAGDFFAMVAPWLVAAALVDWLVTRTITRFAIFVPKTPEMITGYQWLNWLGQGGSTVAAFLALLGVGAIVVIEWKARREWRLALPMVGLAMIGALAPFFRPAIWLPGYSFFVIVVLLALIWRVARTATPVTMRLALLLSVLAMAAAALYQAAPTLYALLRWPGPPAWGTPLFRLGEGLVILGAVALCWAYGRRADRRSWLAGCLLAILFMIAYLAAPAMTATIVVWSHGLTLTLPPWLYAVALLLFGATVVHALRIGRRSVAYALLLLAAAGYAPQLSSQFWFGVIGLWLLSEESKGEIQIGHPS